MRRADTRTEGRAESVPWRETLLLTAVLALTQPACVVVGRSSAGGWFLWPGGLGLLVMIALFFWLFGRR